MTEIRSPARRGWQLVGRLCAAALALCVGAAVADPPLRIVNPAPQEMVHDNSGRVPVIVTGAPRQARLQALLDGKPHGPPRRAPAFELEGVPRGEHTLQVQVLGPGGQELARTPPVVFHVWQASALFR